MQQRERTTLEEETEQMFVAEVQRDAQWKLTQQNTFTRWVNKQLKCIDLCVLDLETDFEDGLKLIRLVEVLSGRSLGRYSKKVVFRSQKLENNALALNFLENEEHIKIVNIDSAAIVDRNLKLIMGLIWTLIVHYSIANQIWELPAGEEEEVVERTPKEKLMIWIRGKLPGDVEFKNFTSDWKSGILLGALVESCAPDLRIGWRNWDPANALHSTRIAMDIAEKHLDVAPLITAEELINESVDEKSMMTYLAQFPQANYKPPMGVVDGLDTNAIVGKPYIFTLRTMNESTLVDALIRDPNDKSVDVIVVKETGQLYSIQYHPRIEGPYEITLKMQDAVAGDTSEVIVETVVAIAQVDFVYEGVAYIGEKAIFTLENAGDGLAEIVLVDPKGFEHVLAITQKEMAYIAEFEPRMEGTHTVHVLCNKKPVGDAPYTVVVHPKKESVTAWGRGLTNKGVRVGDMVWIYVKATDQSALPLRVRVKGPAGDVPVREFFDEATMMGTFCYVPQVEGVYEVDVESGIRNVESKTTLVHVEGACVSRVRAFGPGLQDGVVMQPCTFFVQTTSPSQRPKVMVRYAGGKSVELDSYTQSEDGFMLFEYKPEKAGIYEVSVLCDGEHIRESPFIVAVDEDAGTIKPAYARVYGIDSKQHVTGDETVSFVIDTANAGEGARPTVTVLDANFIETPLRLKKRQSGVFEGSFSPKCAGRYYVMVSIGGIAVPGTPFVVDVEDESGKVCELSETISQIRSGQQVEFAISAKGSIPKVVEALLITKESSYTGTDIKVTDNGDGTFTAQFIAPQPGTYKLNISFDGRQVGLFDIDVEPAQVDVSRIRVEGFEGEENEPVLVGERRVFSINIEETAICGKGLEMMVRYPHAGEHHVELIRETEGVYIGEWEACEEGDVTLYVLSDGVLLKEMHVHVAGNADASKCRAEGDGLDKAIVGEISKFKVDVQDAGKGELQIAIKGPNETKSTVTEHSDGSCLVEYIPSAPGMHRIDIAFGSAKQPIPGSPFMVMADYARDMSKIQLHGFEGVAMRGLPVLLVVDASQTAAEKVEARLPIQFNEPLVEEVEPRVYHITFSVTDDAEGIIPLEVLYGGQPITKSPLQFQIMPTSRPDRIELKSASGGIFPNEAPASLPFSFVIDKSDTFVKEEITVEIKGPDGKLYKANVEEASGGRKYAVSFTPDIAGVYSICVFIKGEPISLSPYQLECKPVGNADKCVVIDMPKEECWGAGESKRFAVDVGGAGMGALNVLPSAKDGMKVDIEQIEDGLYDITLTPLTIGMHRVMLFYGGREIPSGVFWFECMPQSELEEQRRQEVLERSKELEDLKPEETDLRNSPIGASRHFKFAVDKSVEIRNMGASVRTPSGEHHSIPIKEAGDGTVAVKYVPTEVGKHVLSIKHNGVDMDDSPLDFYVVDDDSVTVEGCGIERAIAGQPAEFVITTKRSSAQNLAVVVEGVARAKIVTRDEGDGRCTVTWIAPIPGEYLIQVKLAGEHIKGSPFRVFATGKGYRRTHVSVESASEMVFEVSNANIGKFSATFKSPLGFVEQCPIRVIDANHIGVQFTPREAGTHEISITKNGCAVEGSPFCVPIKSDEVGEASRVIVSGAGKEGAICLTNNELNVDTCRAGPGKIFVSVQGPSRADVKCDGVEDDLFYFSYRPTEPGLYVVAVKFNDQHTEGSPFTVECIGEGMGNVEEVLSKEVSQVPIVMPGQETYVALQLSGCDPSDLTARVIQPNGKSGEARLEKVDSARYLIKFKPEVKGVHIVSVFYKGQHIAGSPFPFTVGRFEEGGAYKIRIGGIDHTIGKVNETLSFNIYAREAGEGKLEVSVEGPSHAAMKICEHEDGNLHVEYSMNVAGVYDVAVKFNDEHVPDSPFKVFLSEPHKNAQMELPIDTVRVGTECAIRLTVQDRRGRLEARVRSPNNNVEEMCVLRSSSDDRCYRLSFIPKEIGTYMVELSLNGLPMRVSPIRVRAVPSSEGGDATLVRVHSEGMRSIKTGQQSQFMLDTRNAGHGLIYVLFEGPSRVALDGNQVKDGEYVVRYTTFAPGTYYATIKYSDVHVPGSPFKIVAEGSTLSGSSEYESSILKIDATSHAHSKSNKMAITELLNLEGEASKVTVDGEGLKKFTPGKPASFFIDTTDAGVNFLMLGVLGAHGPCEEVHVTHVGKGRYEVNYVVTEGSDALIFIKYGQASVPGSPFVVSS